MMPKPRWMLYGPRFLWERYPDYDAEFRLQFYWPRQWSEEVLTVRLGLWRLRFVFLVRRRFPPQRVR